MTKVYTQNNAVLIEAPGEELIYLNTGDTRLYFSASVFMINDGQTNKMYELGAYTNITDQIGTGFASYGACLDYLLVTIESAAGEEGASVDGGYTKKIIEMNTAETYYKMTYYDVADVIFFVKEVREGITPSEIVDTTKTIVITNDYA